MNLRSRSMFFQFLHSKVTQLSTILTSHVSACVTPLYIVFSLSNRNYSNTSDILQSNTNSPMSGKLSKYGNKIRIF